MDNDEEVKVEGEEGAEAPMEEEAPEGTEGEDEKIAE